MGLIKRINHRRGGSYKGGERRISILVLDILSAKIFMRKSLAGKWNGRARA